MLSKLQSFDTDTPEIFEIIQHSIHRILRIYHHVLGFGSCSLPTLLLKYFLIYIMVYFTELYYRSSNMVKKWIIFIINWLIFYPDDETFASSWFCCVIVLTINYSISCYSLYLLGFPGGNMRFFYISRLLYCICGWMYSFLIWYRHPNSSLLMNIWGYFSINLSILSGYLSAS